MYPRKHQIDVTTLSDQTAIAYSPVITGAIHSIRYVKSDFTNGVDFTITAETTGRNIWTQANVDASATVAPRQPTHSVAGVASLYAGSGEAVNDRIHLAAERVKIVIAAGGALKSGTFYITFG